MGPQIAEQIGVPIRLLIVDDHVILRQGIQVMLNDEEDFEVVGEAENGKAALALAKEELYVPYIVVSEFSVNPRRLRK
jgi:DNA-binding NarL/FixJ family response regulator